MNTLMFIGKCRSKQNVMYFTDINNVILNTDSELVNTSCNHLFKLLILENLVVKMYI